MNCFIWNCRGARGRNFHNLVRECTRIYHLDFVAILEPRISGITAERVIRKIGMIEGARIDAVGFSGGIWCLWKSNCPLIRVLTCSRHCVHLIINENSPNAWYMSIVYASPTLIQREETWNELRNHSLNINGPWMVGGDFNAIVSSREKQGGAPPVQSSCLSFNSCIEDCSLIDLGFSGPPFTWSRGEVKERLDRALGNSVWLNKFPDCSITNLPISSSDHFGLWIKPNSDSNRRHNYFKFNGAWLDPDFPNQVNHSWTPSAPWNENIDNLTQNLKIWNIDVSGNIFRRKERIIRRLEGINKVLMVNPIERLIHLRKDLWEEYNLIVKQEENYWFQQSRSKWLMMADCNTKFFHQSAIIKRRRNRISSLLGPDDIWIYDDLNLQNLVSDFFKNLYQSAGLENVNFPTLSTFPNIKERDRTLLESPVSIDEIKRALFSMKNFKAPGPDGFHPIFFKSQWNAIGGSVYSLVNDCFSDPSKIGSLNNTLLTLIPKKDDISYVNQLRPIALCNVSYKIITKVIAQRLRIILPYIVNNTQSSFIPGRSTSDNITVLQ